MNDTLELGTNLNVAENDVHSCKILLSKLKKISENGKKGKKCPISVNFKVVMTRISCWRHRCLVYSRCHSFQG